MAGNLDPLTSISGIHQHIAVYRTMRAAGRAEVNVTLRRFEDQGHRKDVQKHNRGGGSQRLITLDFHLLKSMKPAGKTGGSTGRLSADLKGLPLQAQLQAGNHVFDIGEVWIDPQGGFIGLQRRLQIASAYVDHAKAAQGPEMPGFQFNHAGNICTRSGIIATHEPNRRPLVPGFGKFGMSVNDPGKQIFCIFKSAPVHQGNANLHKF